MKPPLFDYVQPSTLEEALALLAQGDCQPLAGGQSLIPALNFRLSSPGRLVDIARIASLRGISVRPDGVLVAGAMTRHRDVELSADVRERLPLLSKAMHEVAHVAIRNRGTIGGSLAHGDPAADWPVLCLASDATMVLRSSSNERQVLAEDFSVGLFTTAIEPGELLTAIHFPAWPSGRRWAVNKFTRRRGDFAIVGVALTVDLDEVGRCSAARIALQGVSDHPVLARTAQAVLVGHKLDAALVEKAAQAALDGLSPGADLHADAEYRRTLVVSLVRRSLSQALGLEPQPI